MENNFSALILASGLSERMGRPKPLLLWDGKMTFLEKIIGEYLRAGCRKVVCTVNRLVLPFCNAIESGPQVKIVLNEHPEWARIHSVRLGLEEVKDDSFCFLQNADNPFITDRIISKIGEAADPERWCSPEYHGKGGHPVLLPYPVMRNILENPATEVILQEILAHFPKKVVEMDDDAILKNINTPEDYQSIIL